MAVYIGEKAKHFRSGKPPYDWHWVTIKNGQEVPEHLIGRFAPEELDEPAPSVNPEAQIAYRRKLIGLPGVGRKTADDIIAVAPTEEALRAAIAADSLPFRDDVAQKIKDAFQ